MKHRISAFLVLMDLCLYPAFSDNDDDEEHTYEMVWPADVKDQDYKIGNISVAVKQGDITEEKADCIVNSSNEALDLKRGTFNKCL